MLKQIILLVIIPIITFTQNQSQWISLDGKSNQKTEPKVELLSSDAENSVIRIELSGFMKNEFISEGVKYHNINIDDEAITTKIGFPEISHIAKILAIPDNGDVSLEVVEIGKKHIFNNIELAPARKSWLEGDPETPYEKNTEAYSSSEVYPNTFAKVEKPAIFRDFRIARVSIFPVRYFPNKKELEVYSSITIRVKYSSNKGENEKTIARKPIAPSFNEMYKSFIFNYDEVKNRLYSTTSEGYDVMLCIMPDEFAASFQVYADWKHKSGTYIHITKFSDIGANSNNPQIIKNYITQVYSEWEMPPSHILIIGDDGTFPVQYVSYDYTFAYDDYFVEVEGNDFFPEMYIGRFTNQGNYRMRVMLNKFMGYEIEPYTDDAQWFKSATICSNNQYQSQVDTKRFAADVLREDGGFHLIDTLLTDQGENCQYSLYDVTSGINEGRSFLNYRGEGWTTGWWSNCYNFQVSDVQGLNNGRKLTFVTSIGCGVAMFDAAGEECFGETWVELGSTDQPRGAVAFVGPSSNTHTTYNNRIDKGIYVGMFREGLDSPGEALMRGKIYMYNVFGDVEWVEYHFRIYHVLGDPSIHIWKKSPTTPIVTHPTQIPVGYSQPVINVSFGSLSSSPKGAEVILSNSEIFEVAYADANGNVELNLTPTIEQTLHIVVRGENIIPYIDSIQIVLPVENVGFSGNPILSEVSGNGNSMLNPNEESTITFTLKNWGLETAENVQATLVLSDTVNNVNIITTQPINFGDIAPGVSVMGEQFNFFVERDCPVDFRIPLRLNIQSTNSSWSLVHYELVHGCQLTYSANSVDDAGSSLRNFRIDPGETVKLMIQIQNIGDDIASNVQAILHSNDVYTTIVDSVGTFTSLLPDSSFSNNTDYFVVNVDENCPEQREIEFTITLKTTNSFYPYETTKTFKVPVSVPTGIDYTGPDDYGYYAYSTDDILFNQKPNYDWFEISGIGILVPQPTEVSDFGKLANLPFVFNYYGNSYSQIQINSDGWIAFAGNMQNSWQNNPLPHNDGIRNMVAAFWDDLYAINETETGKLYYYFDHENHRFIIEWDEVGHYSNSHGSTDKESFQIILLDHSYYPTLTGDGEIIFQYKEVEAAGSCTVGIENYNENIGLQYVFDDNFLQTETEITNEFAIRFTTNTPSYIVGIDEDDNNKLIPTKYELFQNYPNPFNPSTTISFALPEKNHVKLEIFDVIGRKVATLVNKSLVAGNHEIKFDASKLNSGVYIYRMWTDKFQISKKMILLK